MSKKMRAAVIGCGAISERLHVPDYAVCPEAEIVALCDADTKRAKALAHQWAPNAQVFADYKKMLKEVKPDCVTITLPNFLHAKATIDSLKAGAHVLVEKPMATSIAECKRMVDAAKKAKKLLMVNQSQRRFPAHVKAKEILESGLLGKILHVTAMFGHAGPENWSPTGKWFFDKKRSRFGAMADLGVHKADLVRFLTGKEITEIAGFTACLEKKGSSVEDNFVSAIKFKDGTVGTLCASWTIKGMDANYTIFHCANGTLRVGEIPGKPLVAKLHHPECEIDFDPAPTPNDYPGNWGLDVSGGFVRAAMKKEKPFCTGVEGMKSLEVIFAAEKSAETGRAVKTKH
jgi:predicted dehydrogenase